MSLRFIQEDGQRNAYDEEGFEPVEMDVASVQFPLGNVTDYDSYMDLKPPKKNRRWKKCKNMPLWKEVLPSGNTRGIAVKKKHLFRLIYEKDYTVPQAVEELDIKRRTAYYWFKKDQDGTIKNLTEKDLVQQVEKKKVGCPKILGEEYKQFLKKMYGDESGTTVSGTVEGLITEFLGLKIAKARVHDFMTNGCVLSIKKASFEPEDRNRPDSIAARFDWAVKLMETDIDFQSNCVFID